MTNLELAREIIYLLELEPEWIAIKINNSTKRIDIFEDEIRWNNKKTTIEDIQHNIKELEVKLLKKKIAAKRRQEDGGEFLTTILDSIQDIHEPNLPLSVDAIKSLKAYRPPITGGQPKWWIVGPAIESTYSSTMMIVEQHGMTKKFRLSRMSISYSRHATHNKRGEAKSTWSTSQTAWYVAKNFLERAVEVYPPLTATLADPKVNG